MWVMRVGYYFADVPGSSPNANIGHTLKSSLDQNSKGWRGYGCETLGMVMEAPFALEAFIKTVTLKIITDYSTISIEKCGICYSESLMNAKQATSNIVIENNINE